MSNQLIKIGQHWIDLELVSSMELTPPNNSLGRGRTLWVYVLGNLACDLVGVDIDNFLEEMKKQGRIDER